MNFLAKLREFKSGMSVDGYLNTEMRQNFRAISSFFNDISQRFYDPVVVYANPVQGFSNSSGFFDISGGIVRDGSVIDSYYYPKASGRYFIEFSGAFQNVAVANGSMSIQAVTNSTGDLIDPQGLTDYFVSGGVVVSNPSHIGFFADLSPRIGVGFKGVSTVSGLNLSNFNLKITKVG